MAPSGPQDRSGAPVPGAASQSHAKRGEALRDAQALARGLVALAGHDPEALRRAVGPDDAMRVLRLAGVADTPRVREWAEVRSEQEAQASAARARTAAMYARDPDHDPRVVEAITSGRSMAEISAVRASVAGEYDSAREPTTAERYAAMRAEHDRLTAEGQRQRQRSRALSRAPAQPAGRPPGLAHSGMPGDDPAQRPVAGAALTRLGPPGLRAATVPGYPAADSQIRAHQGGQP